MHVWHRLTGHAVSSVRILKKRATSLQNVIRKKEERLKRAPRTDLSVRPTSGWKALRTTGKSSCMEVVMWTETFLDRYLAICLPLSVKPAAPGMKPATAIHLLCCIATHDLSTFFGPQASYHANK